MDLRSQFFFSGSLRSQINVVDN